MMVTAADVFRYTTIAELCSSDAGRSLVDQWLSPGESRMHARLGDSSRRQGWLAGRVLAKRMLLDHLAAGRKEGTELQPRRVEIDSGDVRRRGRRPAVRLDGRSLPVSLSISHTDGAVLVALACEAGVSVGADLVDRAELGAGFARMWFTPAERRWLESEGDPELAATIWAIKEAVYKAVNRGEAFRPRSVEVLPAGQDGRILATYPGRGGRVQDPHVWRTPQDEIAVVVMHAETEAEENLRRKR